MSETSNQITRREILKRGAFVGGAIVWATPVVQTLGMGRAFAQTPSQVCTPTSASRVGQYLPGLRYDGSDVPGDATGDEIRNDPTRALGLPDGQFVSLGFGGALVLGLADRYYAGNSGSALLIETTRGASGYPEERAGVYVSENTSTVLPLSDWVKIGEAANHDVQPTLGTTTIDLDSTILPPPNFLWVKLVDISTKSDFVGIPNADGYDVDSVRISCPTP